MLRKLVAMQFTYRYEKFTLKPALSMILISAGSLSPNLIDTMSPTTSLPTVIEPNSPSRRTEVSYNTISLNTHLQRNTSAINLMVNIPLLHCIVGIYHNLA